MRTPYAKFPIVLVLLIFSLNICADDEPTPAEIMREIELISQKDLWPGFNPASYPVAFFDGESTWLCNHPGTPEGFTASENGILVFEGRHPLMVANSSVEMDGVPTATVLLNKLKNVTRAQIAGLTVHELFHVFAGEHYGSFSANEALLFTYPFADSRAMALRRMETEAMRHTYSADDPEKAGGWTMRALLLRMERAALIGSQYIDYERTQEMNEGLAQFVEDRAADADPAKRIPEKGWAPDQVRTRIYTSGQFWAERLDAYFPEWKGLFGLGSYADLDVMLMIVMTQLQIQPLDFTSEEKTAFEDEAKAAIKAYESRLAAERKEFEALPGWRIEVVVEQGANLLVPRGFDPLNVLNLGEGNVLHTRMLKLGNNQGQASMINLRAVSFGPNEHPLFNGVRSAIFAGIEQEPDIDESNGSVRISSEGIDIAFDNVAIERPGEHTIRLLLRPPSP